MCEQEEFEGSNESEGRGRRRAVRSVTAEVRNHLQTCLVTVELLAALDSQRGLSVRAKARAGPCTSQSAASARSSIQGGLSVPMHVARHERARQRTDQPGVVVLFVQIGALCSENPLHDKRLRFRYFRALRIFRAD